MPTLLTGIAGVVLGAGIVAGPGVMARGGAPQTHPDTAAARESLQTLMGRYRKTFEQESVLWETARVCAAT